MSFVIQDNLFLENWEVFTQALKDVYPGDINDPKYSDHKAVVQLLLESNVDFQLSCTLYEVVNVFCFFLILFYIWFLEYPTTVVSFTSKCVLVFFTALLFFDCVCKPDFGLLCQCLLPTFFLWSSCNLLRGNFFECFVPRLWFFSLQWFYWCRTFDFSLKQTSP